MQAAKKFAGKVALVTGGTDGIGLACAERLGQRGASVVICGRSEDKLTAAMEKLKASKIECMGLTCHVGDTESRKSVVKQAIEKYGGVDYFVQSAAVNPKNGRFLQLEETKWDHIMNVNVKASFALTQLLYPTMKARGGGAVVYISSTAGSYQGKYEDYFGYSLSKSCLDNLAKFVSPELGEANITVNSVIAGLFNTEFAKGLHEDPAMVRQIQSAFCVQKSGELPQIAGMVEYLCSEEGSYTTGSKMFIDGGTKVRCC